MLIQSLLVEISDMYFDLTAPGPGPKISTALERIAQIYLLYLLLFASLSDNSLLLELHTGPLHWCAMMLGMIIIA